MRTEVFIDDGFGVLTTNPTSVVDLIFRNPVVTVAAVMKHAGVSRPAASAALRRAEARGWLRSAGRWGRGGRERWVATEIWSAVSSENAFDDKTGARS